MFESPIFLQIGYLIAIIIIPLVPAWILYTMIPSSKGENSDVKGTLFGLNIKFSGAFAGYLILVLLSWNFISKQLDNTNKQVTDNQAEFYTVNGKVDISSFDDYQKNYNNLNVFLSPPETVFYSDGTFRIENVPIPTKKKETRLIISEGSEENKKEAIVLIQESSEKPPFMQDPLAQVEFRDDHQIYISTPIVLKSLSDAGGY